MSEDEARGLVHQSPGALAPSSHLAERTLAARAERERRLTSGIGTHIVGPGGYRTVREAVAVAGDGDVILVKPGRYEGGFSITGKSITVKGDGARDEIVLVSSRGDLAILMGTSSTLANLTMIGPGEDSVSLGVPSVLLSGGASRLEGLRIAQGGGVIVCFGAQGSVVDCVIEDNARFGITVADGSSPLITGNEVARNSAGIVVSDSDTRPHVLANRIHHNQGGGIVVARGASALIEENDVWANEGLGVSIVGLGAGTVVRANRVHDGEGIGIGIGDGASPLINENDVSSNAKAGIAIRGEGTAPTVTENLIRGNFGGIQVWQGASPAIGANQILDSLWDGIEILGVYTSPSIHGNIVRNGARHGISVGLGAAPTIQGNVVARNAREPIHVEIGAFPVMETNEISG